MKGIQFVVDGSGRKMAVQIDLKKQGRLWEDFYDRALVLDGVIMLGCPGPDYQNPRRLGRLTQSLYAYVDDVDKHCEQARRAGAKIVEAPADQFYGDRRYGAEDPEGHCWYFAQHVRDVAPEAMKPPA